MNGQQEYYSTLEVDVERNHFAEVGGTPLPEVNRNADADLHYPEVVSNSNASGGVSGGGGSPLYDVKVDSTPPEVVGAVPPATPIKPVAAEPRICGVKRKIFWAMLIGAAIVIVAVVVGVAVGVTTSRTRNSTIDSSGQNEASINGKALFTGTDLASANFTDEFGNENYLVAYQLNSGAIYMSAWNSSNSKWVVSPVVDGSDADRSLDSVRNGTSLSLDVFRINETSRELHIYWQLPPGGGFTTINSLVYEAKWDVSTTAKLPTSNWANSGAGNNYVSLARSPIVSYGKQCDLCNQYTYMYWRVEDGVREASLQTQTGGWQSENDAISVGGLEAPSSNSSMALAHAGALTTKGHRSMNIFYRASTSGLARIINGDGMYNGDYLGREIGPNTTITAFSTGFNETGDNFPQPLGFQVLTMDPDADDGVQLTYWKGNSWTSRGGQVDALADCKPRGVMAVNQGRRIYCLVDAEDGGGVEIVEFAWKGDPSDTSTYGNYDRVGVVSTAV
ncbi:hypothetical protein F4779DRAFT_549035 [Xylariaceae sp. FL0662B]|nr:hypothetical protein F4779DRAFT_549035 [Xylariaceae sp. FL0662B]